MESTNVKRKDIVLKEKVASIKSEEPLLERMKTNQGDGLYRDSAKYREIVWDGTLFKMHKEGKSINDIIFKKGFFLFTMVQSDAKRWLKERNNVVPEIEQHPVNFTNYDFDIKNKNIVGVDLTAAYWYIARNLGIISQKTFDRGMQHMIVEFRGEVKKGDLLKPIRLSALSVLGKKKTYFKIVNGERTKDTVLMGGNEQLEQVYKLIRYTCYFHMHRVMKMLSMPEFLCWKTDCIYFHDTDVNRRKVMNYFDAQNLDYKLLKNED